MITREEILMGRDSEYPLTSELEDNLSDLLEKVNLLRKLYGKPMYVSSGYRPGKYNVKAGGAKTSAHLYCEAVDFKDVDGELKKFCTIEILEQCGLYMEDPKYTKTWLHVQTRKPGSGNRVFKP
jgi:uncharacterized protein YcbK (DUF882 family)